MSDQKTLGQVAWEDFWSSVNRPVKWSACPNEHAEWERAAEAVKSAYGNTQEVIEQSQNTHRAGYERGLAEGAAEERERCARELKAAIRAWPNHNKPLGGPSLASVLRLLADSWGKP